MGFFRRKNYYNMIFEQDISEHAKIVYLYLCRCADSEGQSFPSQNTIGKKCSIKSRQTVSNALKELESIGLLDRESRYRKDGGQTSNLYVIYDSPKPPAEEKDTPCPANGHPPVQQMDTPCPANGHHEVLPNEGLPKKNNNNREQTKKQLHTTKNKEVKPKKDVVVSQDELDELKTNIDTTVGTIQEERLVKLIEDVGVEPIKHQLKNFPKFKKVQSILNPVGFFISAILGNWEVPESSRASKKYDFNNFEQHEYTEGYLEQLFVKV